MQSLCLRRMKQQIDTKTQKTMVELPPKFEVVRWLDLADGERRLYTMAEDIAKNKYQAMATSGTLLKNYIHILKIILRLRQLCTHPRLWSEDKWKEAKVLAVDTAVDTQSQTQSQVRQSDLPTAQSEQQPKDEKPAASKEEKPLITEMKPEIDGISTRVLSHHTSVNRRQAARLWIARQRSQGYMEEPADAEQQDEITKMCGEYETSTKIAALLSDLEKIRSHAWISDPVFQADQDHPLVVKRVAELAKSPGIAEKSVVFSQWTTMLDLIEPRLRQNKIRFARLDGTMSRTQRTANLD
ncbi:hypothetical protein FBU59_006084, partial [Linderina macrospora]